LLKRKIPKKKSFFLRNGYNFNERKVFDDECMDIVDKIDPIIFRYIQKCELCMNYKKCVTV